MKNVSTLTAAALIALAGQIAGAQQDTIRHQARRARRTPATPSALDAQARISRDSAQIIALAGLPAGSTVREAELEKEKGTVVWSFDIKVPGKRGVDEVLVSALDGHVVAKSHESAKKEAAEAAQDRRAAKKP